MAVQHTKILSWKLTRRKKWLVKTKERTLTQFCSSMRPTPLKHWAWSRRSWWTAEWMEDLLDRVWRDCSLSLPVILTEGDYNAICCTIKFELVWQRLLYIHVEDSCRMKHSSSGSTKGKSSHTLFFYQARVSWINLLPFGIKGFAARFFLTLCSNASEFERRCMY